MSQCANCQEPLSEDPNELEDLVECRYCDAVLCSEPCAEAHEVQVHPDEALPAAEDDERR